MAADEEIAGHEIGGEDVNPNPVLPPTIDRADTDQDYAGHEYAGQEVPDDEDLYEGYEDQFAFTGDAHDQDAYGEVEYAGDYVDETAVYPSLPTTNVEEFETSVGRLGCGVPTVFITSRCNSSMVCQFDLSDISKITWSRRLDEVSEAEVEIGLSGSSTQTCCQCLAIVEPWCHELHIWRDGEEVWVGPIESVLYQRESVVVKARDSLAWLDVRIPYDDIEFKSTPALGLSGPSSDLTDIAEFIIQKAFAEDVLVGRTCEVDHLWMVNTGEVVDYYSEAFSSTYLEVLLNVVDSELNVTTLGRTIILTGDTFSLTPLGLLNDEHIMGEIEVTKDGLLQANRVYVHFEGDENLPGVGQKETDERYCYSLIEKMADGSGLQLRGDADAVADSYVQNAFIAPRTVQIPAGSRLSPDTPWTINQMVPGAKVDVAITRLCLELTQSFILVGVSVEYSAGEGESVGIELSPINNLGV